MNLIKKELQNAKTATKPTNFDTIYTCKSANSSRREPKTSKTTTKDGCNLLYFSTCQLGIYNHLSHANLEISTYFCNTVTNTSC
jgi:hypothetical protein